MKLGNNLWETRQYRTPGTATVFQLGTSQGGGEKLELEYHFSGNALNGNLLSHVIRQRNRTWTQNYDYDGLNRLWTASEAGGWSRAYGYDQYRNRWVIASSGVQCGHMLSNGVNGRNTAATRGTPTTRSTAGCHRSSQGESHLV